MRLEHLDQLIISNKIDSIKESSLLCAAADVSKGQKVSVETLLDCLIVLFDECQNSSLRREKTVSEFIELSKILLSHRKHITVTSYYFCSETSCCQYQATSIDS